MALFSKFSKYTEAHPANYQRQRMYLVEDPARLPGYMKRLDIICRRTEVHPIPTKMRFIGEGVSDKGQPMSIYACPFSGCNWREGWVQDYRTSKPIRLWAGFFNC